jgi:hypothetical protein
MPACTARLLRAEGVEAARSVLRVGRLASSGLLCGGMHPRRQLSNTRPLYQAASLGRRPTHIAAIFARLKTTNSAVRLTFQRQKPQHAANAMACSRLFDAASHHGACIESLDRR